MTKELRRAFEPFGFPSRLLDVAEASFEEVQPAWLERDRTATIVGAKVINCFQTAGLHEGHLAGSTGYGYHDLGRETYEALLARTLDAQAAIARIQLASGTHAIVASVNALLGPTGTLVSATGQPYDTLRVALTVPLERARGNRYLEVAFSPDGSLDIPGLRSALGAAPDVVFVQRSRGYAARHALSIAEIAEIVRVVREQSPSSVVLVDNCYGEFVEPLEPSAVDADVVIGSLIKNPGGGLAPAGAYVAGKSEIVERIAGSIFSVGLARKVGPTLDATRWLFAGLHRAPKVVAESLKILDFAAALFTRLGYPVDPKAGAKRHDTIQAIRLGDAVALQRFTEGLQRMLPINSRARPEPGPVPGYDDPVIMGMGSFIAGSTMELSCDAPLRPPFEVYLQGGMDVTHGMIGVLSAAQALI
ncbi:MAG TPA: methionine gamma-lyase family protein [Candidatus Acidoferrales bacterium]|nr:methionine gamma-lyase family protein [Candidatus Acidoferrales bacterium]